MRNLDQSSRWVRFSIFATLLFFLGTSPESFAQFETAMGSTYPEISLDESINDSEDLNPLSIIAIKSTNETGCGTMDGTLRIKYSGFESGETYRVRLLFDGRSISYDGFQTMPIIISGLAPGTYNNIIIEKESDQTKSNAYGFDKHIDFNCEGVFGAKSISCGTGDACVTDCDGNQSCVDRQSLQINTYNLVGSGSEFPVCMAEVNGACNLENPDFFFCLDVNRASPNQLASFAPVTGLGNSGESFTDLQVSQVNYLLANAESLGIDPTDINSRAQVQCAIWGILNSGACTNTLYNTVLSNVQTANWSDASGWEILVPSISSIQPFIKWATYGAPIEDCCPGQGSKPSVLYVQYTGEDCSATNTSQIASLWACSGDPQMANTVYIIANDNIDPNDPTVWFAGEVTLGEYFALKASNAGETRLKGETYIHVFDTQGGNILQQVDFHTSCSEPLATGDQYGSIKIAGLVEDVNNTLFCGSINDIFGCFGAVGSGTVISGDLGGTESNGEGQPDDLGVNIYTNGHIWEVQMEGYIPAGEDFVVRARERAGQSGDATFDLYESFDGINYTLHPNSANFTLTNGTDWTELIITANTGFNYLRFGKGNTSTTDYEVDAIYSSNCTTSPVINPTGWDFACEDDVDVEILGNGIEGFSTFTQNISNPGNTFATVVEIVYKGSTPGDFVDLTDNFGTVYTANRQIPPGTSSNVSYYRFELPGGVSSVTYAESAATSSLQSLVVYVFRQGLGNNTSSTGIFASQSLFNDTYDFTLNVPANNSARDIRVSVPLSEITNDGRVATVVATAGGVTASQTINGSSPVGTCCLNIVELDLFNVPGNTTTIDISVQSQAVGGVNPQSLVLAGLVEAEVECGCINITDAGSITGNETICGPYNPAIIDNEVSASGGNGGSIEYRWLISTDDNNYVEIPGATGASYDPPSVISQTTYYRRQARRTTCTQWVTSGTVLKIVRSFPENVQATVNQELNCDNASVQLFGSSSTANVNYSWSGPNGFSSNQQNPIVSNPGTYTLTVNFDGCTETDNVTVVQDLSAPSASASVSGPITCSNPSVTLQGSSSTPNVSYSWSGPSGFSSSQQNPTTSTPGSYTLVVTKNSNGCSTAANVTVLEDTDAPGASANGGLLTCVVTSVTLQGSSPTSGVTYSWSGPNGFSSGMQNPTVSVQGLYTLTVTDPSNGCTSSTSTAVDENTDAPNASAMGGTLTCANTSITLQGNSTTPGATFGWTGPGGFSSAMANPTVSQAGDYTLTVTDPANGCTENVVVNVNQDNTPPTVLATPNGTLTCSNTSVQLIGFSDAANSTYSWSGPGGFSSMMQSPSVSTPGIYTLTVVNLDNGCSQSASAQVLQDIDAPGVSASGATITCSNTMVQLTGDSPTSGVIFGWEGPNSFQTNVQNPTVDSPGSYTLTVTDPSNGCTSSMTVQVDTDLTSPEASATGGMLTCTTTSVQLMGSSSSNGVTYSWTGPGGFSSGMQNPTVSVAGTYTLTVTNPSNGCSSTADATVNEDTTAPNASAAGGTITCSSPSVQLSGSSTTAGVSFGWTGPGGFSSAMQNPTVSVAGTYTLTVTDPSNGCTATADAMVDENLTSPDISATGGDLDCTNASVSLSGGSNTAGATFSWAGPGGFSSAMQNPTVSAEGSYTLTVTDPSNGCTSSTTVQVGFNDNLTPAFAQFPMDGMCSNLDAVFEAVDAGTGATYSWDFGLEADPATATGIGPHNVLYELGGIKTITLTVTLGSCTETISQDVDITMAPEISTVFADDPTCEEGGFIFISTLGGPSLYEFNIGDGNGFIAQQNMFQNLPAGSYNITIRNLDGSCPIEYVNNPVVLTAAIPPSITNVQPVDPSSCGGADGTITVTASGPDGAIEYRLPGVTGWQSSGFFNGLSAGSYFVEVRYTDETCLVEAGPVTLMDPALPVPAFANIPSELCVGETGSFSAVDSGPDVQYSWDFGADASPATQMGQGPLLVSYSSAGTKTVTLTVSKNNGCASSITGTVIVKPLPLAQIVPVSESCVNEGILIQAANAGPGATYQWDFGVDASPSTSTNISETVVYTTQGSKTLTLTTELNGCTNTTQIAITVNTEVFADAGLDRTICDGEATTLGGQLGSGPAGATYQWTPSDGLNDPNVESPVAAPGDTTTYTLTVTFGACVTSAQVTVNVDVNSVPFAFAGNDVFGCAGESVTLGGSGNTPTGTVGSTYFWTSNPTDPTLTDPTAENPVVNPVVNTTYTVTVSKNGCEKTDEVEVTTISATPADAGDDVSLCIGDAGVLIGTSNSPFFQYTWSPTTDLDIAPGSGGLAIATPDVTTIYTLTQVDANGCTSVDEVVVIVEDCNDPPVAINDINNTLIDTPVGGNVITNDSDPNNDNLTVTTTPISPVSNGTLVLNSDGSYVYTPDPGFVGTDQFTYEVCDDGVVGPKCDQAIVTIEVRENTSDNNPPIANDDVEVTSVNTPVTANLLSNDDDPDGDDLILNTTPINDPMNGSVTILSDGTYTYTPNDGFQGEDTFEYQICDAGGLCDNATVTILVVPGSGNQPPVAVEDQVSTPSGTPVDGNVIPNDSDPENDPLTVSSTPVDGPDNGTITLNPDGSFTYTPNPGFTGQDTITYEVCDPSPSCDQANIVVTVYGQNNLPPVANDDFASTQPGLAVDLDLALNDYDPDLDLVTYTLTPISGPSNGTVVINPDGTARYTPNPSFIGTDQFVYEICDGISGCDQATAFIEVIGNTSQNDPPVAVNDVNITFVNTPVGGNILVNDSDPDGDALILDLLLTAFPSNGFVTINFLGNYTYVPNPGFSGEDQFSYEICDGISGCDQATVFITVLDAPPANDPPVALDDFNSTQESTPVSGDVTPNDFDPNGDPLTVNTTPTVDPNNGTVTINPDGTYTYIPNPGFTGDDSFSYQTCDPEGLCDNAVVTITVYDNPTPDPNRPPFAGDDAAATFVNVPVSGDMSPNDVDPEGTMLTYTTTPVVDVMNGSVVINSDGTFTYTPNNGYIGPDQYVYEVCDAGGECTTATVYLTVFPSNNPPIATNDINNTIVDIPVSGNVSTNDIDPDNDPLTVQGFSPIGSNTYGNTATNPGEGTITLDDPSTGAYTFVPVSGFTGETSFEYVTCDDGAPIPLCDTAIVTIEITEAIDDSPPIANNDNTQTEEGTPVVIPVLTNDFDPEGNPFTGPIQLTNPPNGMVVTNPDGTFTYTPDPGFVGVDTFSYEIIGLDPSLRDDALVTIRVVDDNGSNDPPVAIDDAVFTIQDQPVSGNASSNDSDPDGDSPLTFSQISNPVNGDVVFNPDGTFTYTPDPGYIGPDEFIYEVCDGISGCDLATVHITVGPQNDPPVAENDFNNTLPGVSVTGNVLTNDSDPNPEDQITVSGFLSGGSFVNTALDPTAGFISLVDPLTGEYVFVPFPGFTGTVTYTYQICDDGVPGPFCDEATVTIEVLDDPLLGNQPPVANNDETQTELNTPVTINVVSNDFDPDNDPLSNPSVTLQPNVSGGNLVNNNNGTFTYTPPTGFVGLVEFTYEVCDGISGCDEAIVSINVLPDSGASNLPPVAIDDAEYTGINTSVSGDASTNDSDPDGDSPLTFTQTSNPTNGSVVFNSDGTFTYTPNTNYTGPDEFTYEVCDGISGCDAATVHITVGPVNLPPVAIDDINNTLQDINVSGSVSTNDFDPENDPLTVSGFSLTPGGTYTNSVTIPGEGVLTLDDPSTGAYTFDPDPGFLGSTSPVEYEICDAGGCDAAILVIHVRADNEAGNRPPVANNDNYQTPFNTPVAGNVLPNDFDPDSDPITITNPMPGTPISILTANGGTVALNDDGTFLYSPLPGFTGQDVFSYEICDGISGCDQANVTIQVNNDTGGGNLPPAAVDDAYITLEDTPISSNVQNNDPADPDSDPVVVTQANGTAIPIGGLTFGTINGGTVDIDSDGNFTYTPMMGYFGPDQFTYERCDDFSGCDDATVYITIDSELCIDLQVAVFLEGSYNTTLGGMRTDLNSARSILPGQTPVNPLVMGTPAGNPYRNAPYNYQGTNEEETFAGPYDADVVDWVLVSLRTGTSKTTEIAQANGLVHSDGSVTFIKECVLTSAQANEIYIVIEHRNHMGVMSDTAVAISGGTITYDFRQTNSFRTPTSFGQKQVEPGVFAMFAGDGDQGADFPSYDINGLDNIIWTIQNGNFDRYLVSDYDMNGDVNGADIIIWSNNNGISSAVPKN